MATVGVDDKYGIIDKTGVWIAEPKYDLVHDFCDDIAWVLQRNKVRYIRRDGTVIKPMFDAGTDYEDGVALVMIKYTSNEYIQMNRRNEQESLIRAIEESCASHKLKKADLHIKADGTIVLRKSVYLNLTLNVEVNQDNYDSIISKLKDVTDRMPQLPKLRASDAEILPYPYYYYYATRYGDPKEIIVFYEMDIEMTPADKSVILNPESRPYGEDFKIVDYKKNDAVPKKFEEISRTLDNLKYNYAYSKKDKGFLIQLSNKFTLFIDVINSRFYIYKNKYIPAGGEIYGYYPIKTDKLPQLLRLMSSFDLQKLTTNQESDWIKLLCDGIISDKCPNGTIYDLISNKIIFPFSPGMYIYYQFNRPDELVNFEQIASIFAEVSEKSQEFCDYFKQELPQAKLLAKVKGAAYLLDEDVESGDLTDKYKYTDAYMSKSKLKDKAFLGD